MSEIKNDLLNKQDKLTAGVGIDINNNTINTTDRFKIEGIFNHSATELGTSFKAFNCNWKNYDMLLLQTGGYSNVLETMLISVAYFSMTSVGLRPILYDAMNSIYFEAYQNGENSVMAKASEESDIRMFRIYGIKF